MDVQSAYLEELNYLYSLQKHGIKFGLSQTANLLKAMGNPDLEQKYIHIGGTNGKGSVASFICSILQNSGYSVGLYTSPHLTRFTERIRINSREIPREKLISLVRELKNFFNPEEPPTFFEAVTALALRYFALEKPDIVLLEVGMGGRLDATNVVSPVLSIITNISMEHQEFLGSDLSEIAKEKAGIIKPEVPVVTGVEQAFIQDLFWNKCRENKSALYLLGKQFDYRQTSKGIDYLGINTQIESLNPGLSGEHQYRNSALALASIEILKQKGYKIEVQSMKSGLESTVWPGRMQIIKQNPFVVLDGAHNPEALQALRTALDKHFSYEKLYLVLGIMEDKEVDKLLEIVLPVSDYVLYTCPDYFRALSPKKLESKALAWNKPGFRAKNVYTALRTAEQRARNKDMILVTGSLFTVGEALTYFDPVVYATDSV